MTFTGANPTELRQLAKHFKQTSDSLLNAHNQITHQLQSNTWQGIDSETFYHLWSNKLATQLKISAQTLHSGAIQLRTQADEQDQASTGTLTTYSGFPASLTNNNTDIKNIKQPIAFNADEELGTPVPLPDNISLDLKAIKESANYIHQGQVGDCWALAPIIALARTHLEIFARNIRNNHDGSYTVTLYEEELVYPNEFCRPEICPHYFHTPVHLPRKVEVTVRETRPKGVINSINSTKHFGVASIVEAALAKHYGGYDRINGGYADNAFYSLTGKHSDTYDIEPSLSEIKKELDRGNVVVMNSTLREGERKGFLWFIDPTYDGPIPIDKDQSTKRVVPTHEYAVESVTKHNDKFELTLCNPWGPPSEKIVLTEAEYRERFSDVTVWRK